MPLTLQERQFPASANDAFPTLQLFLLAVCRVAEPIALTSIFPYSWGMVQDLHIATSNDASFYAGILISAFSLAEALTGMYWGGLSDRVGRKPVLLSGCFGTMLSLLLVGFAPNFWVALFGRVLGGALNGNIGVIQTMVGELVKNPDHEPSAYAVMPFVWSIGTILGPAIGGLLVKPAESYPSFFAPTGLFGKFPYLLPNLVCSVLLLISIIFGWLFLYETHPDMQLCNDHISKDYDSLTPLLAAGSDINNRCYETLRQPDSVIQAHLQEESGWTVLERCESVSPFTWKVSMLIVALAIFAYHSMTYDHLFPIFLQDANVRNTPDVSGIDFSIPGGLGLSTHTVGLIMSSDGIIALFIQGIIFPALASRLGAWKLFVIVTILHPVAYFIVPFLVFAPENLLLVGIYTCLVIRNILSIIDYPVLMILLRQASPSDAVMGKVNGLAASASAATRTIAPPIAGLLYSTGAKFGFTALAWWASAVVAMLGAMQLWFMTQHKSTLVMEQPGTSLEYSPQTKPIQVVITDVESNSTRSSYYSL